MTVTASLADTNALSRPQERQDVHTELHKCGHALKESDWVLCSYVHVVLRSIANNWRICMQVLTAHPWMLHVRLQV